MEESLVKWDIQLFMAFELTLSLYKKLGLNREEARTRVLFSPYGDPAELDWFDLRWPE